LTVIKRGSVSKKWNTWRKGFSRRQYICHTSWWCSRNFVG